MNGVRKIENKFITVTTKPEEEITEEILSIIQTGLNAEATRRKKRQNEVLVEIVGNSSYYRNLEHKGLSGIALIQKLLNHFGYRLRIERCRNELQGNSAGSCKYHK